jgi:hypothetical protein
VKTIRSSAFGKTGRSTSALRAAGSLFLLGALVLLASLATGGTSAVAAQERPAAAEDIPGLPPPLPISPGGAFGRALAFPGWGHAAIGSYVRGGVYFSAQTATLYTYGRTRGRLNEARKSLRFRETVLLRELDREGVTDPEDIEQRLDADATLTELELLVESRESQQEDLIAFSLFLVLISAADAYVTAHLARFPEPLDVGAAPSPNGGIDVAVRVPLPN